MIPLTDSENKFYEEQKEFHISQKEFCYDKNKKKVSQQNSFKNS